MHTFWPKAAENWWLLFQSWDIFATEFHLHKNRFTPVAGRCLFGMTWFHLVTFTCDNFSCYYYSCVHYSYDYYICDFLVFNVFRCIQMNLLTSIQILISNPSLHLQAHMTNWMKSTIQKYFCLFFFFFSSPDVIFKVSAHQQFHDSSTLPNGQSRSFSNAYNSEAEHAVRRTLTRRHSLTNTLHVSFFRWNVKQNKVESWQENIEMEEWKKSRKWFGGFVFILFWVWSQNVHTTFWLQLSRIW